jgi:hypothetical protein
MKALRVITSTAKGGTSMKRMLFRVAALVAGTTVLVGSLGGAARAAGTPVDVELAATAQGLTISQPTTAVTLAGGATPGSTLTGTLGVTTVADTRGSLLGWSVTATTTGHLVSTTDPAHTIALGSTGLTGPLRVDVPSVTALGVSLLQGVVPGVGGSLNPTTPVVLATALTGLGGGEYRYDPALTFTVPPNTYAETYRTVVVQTIA